MVKLDDYRAVAPRGAVDFLVRMGERLRGRRVVHVSATRYGGGIVETLNRLVPILNDLGIETGWEIVIGGADFDASVSALGKALGGIEQVIPTGADRAAARGERGQRAAPRAGRRPRRRPRRRADAPVDARPSSGRWVWRAQLRSLRPAARPLAVSPVARCRATTRWCSRWRGSPRRSRCRASSSTPSIDPLSNRNRDMSRAEQAALLDRLGCRATSRSCSRWPVRARRDPLGAINAFRLVRSHHDVPAGSRRQRCHRRPGAAPRPQRGAGGDRPGARRPGPGAATRAASSRSTRSTRGHDRAPDPAPGRLRPDVADAMWKGKPVMGSPAGGIPVQIVPTSRLRRGLRRGRRVPHPHLLNNPEADQPAWAAPAASTCGGTSSSPATWRLPGAARAPRRLTDTSRWLTGSCPPTSSGSPRWAARRCWSACPPLGATAGTVVRASARRSARTSSRARSPGARWRRARRRAAEGGGGGGRRWRRALAPACPGSRRRRAGAGGPRVAGGDHAVRLAVIAPRRPGRAAVVVLDADLRSRAGLARRPAGPVSAGDGLVAPVFQRHVLDEGRDPGPPRAADARAVRTPVRHPARPRSSRARERLAERLLARRLGDRRRPARPRFWLPAAAAGRGVRSASARSGPARRSPASRPTVGATVGRVAGGAFALAEISGGSTGSSCADPPVARSARAPGARGGGVSLGRRRGCWSGVPPGRARPPAGLGAGPRAATPGRPLALGDLAPDEFLFSDRLWARVVYDFLLAYRSRVLLPGAPRAVPGAALPRAGTASLVLETRGAACRGRRSGRAPRPVLRAREALPGGPLAMTQYIAMREGPSAKGPSATDMLPRRAI